MNISNNTCQASLAVVGPELMRNAALAGWWTLLGIAVLVFIYIQRYLQDPERRRLDAEWYEKFEANRRARYAGSELNWRVRDLRDYFAVAPRVSRDTDSPAGGAGPRLPMMYVPVV